MLILHTVLRQYLGVLGLVCFMLEEWTTWLNDTGCLAMDWTMKLCMYSCGCLVSLALAIRCYIIFHRNRRLGGALLLAVAIQTGLAMAVVATELKFDHIEEGYCMKSASTYDNGPETLAFLSWTLALDGGILLASCWKLLRTCRGPFKMHKTSALLFRHSAHYLVSVCVLNAVQFVLSWVSELPKLVVLVLSVQICVALQQLIAEQDAVNGYPHLAGPGGSHPGAGAAYVGKSGPRPGGSGPTSGNNGVATVRHSAAQSDKRSSSRTLDPESSSRRVSDGAESDKSGPESSAGHGPRAASAYMLAPGNAESVGNASKELQVEVRIGTAESEAGEARTVSGTLAPASRVFARTDPPRTPWTWAEKIRAHKEQQEQERQNQVRTLGGARDEAAPVTMTIKADAATCGARMQAGMQAKRIDFLYAPALRIRAQDERLWPPISLSDQFAWSGSKAYGLGGPHEPAAHRGANRKLGVQELYYAAPSSSGPPDTAGSTSADASESPSLRPQSGGSEARTEVVEPAETQAGRRESVSRSAHQDSNSDAGSDTAARPRAPRRKMLPLWLLEGRELELDDSATERKRTTSQPHELRQKSTMPAFAPLSASEGR